MTSVASMSTPRRMVLGLEALGKLVADPMDTEQALLAATLLNARAAERLLEDMVRTPAGQRLLATRATIDTRSVDFAALARLPEGTLGRTYQAFLAARGLEPFGPPDNVEAAELRWLTTRMRQAHDVWHVVTGYDSDLVGELELQAFTYAQTRTPFSLLITIAGLLKAHRGFVTRRVLAAYRRGQRAADFVAVPWEDLWARPLSQVQEQMGL
jgi:ubiquinone biosynthesis protein COQ4